MTETLTFWNSPARVVVTVGVVLSLMLTGCASSEEAVDAPAGQQVDGSGQLVPEVTPPADVTPGPVATASPPKEAVAGPVATAAPGIKGPGPTNSTEPGSQPGQSTKTPTPAPSAPGTTTPPSNLDPSYGDGVGRHTTDNNSMSWVMPKGWEWKQQWSGDAKGGQSEGWTTGLVMSSPAAGDGTFTAIHYGETLYNGENGEPLTPCEPGAVYTILEREPLPKTMTATEKAVAVERVAGRTPGAALADHYLVTQMVKYSWGIEVEIFLSSTQELKGEGCGAYDYVSTPDRQVGLYVGVTDKNYEQSGVRQFKTPTEARAWLGTPEVEAAKNIIRSIDFNVATK